MDFTLKQAEALKYLDDDVTTEMVFGGAVAGGKSYLGTYWLIKMCHKFEGSRWAMARNELKRLKDTTLVTFDRVALSIGLQKDVHYIYNDNKSTITFDNGSVITLLALDHQPSDPNYERFGSYEFTGAFIDECTEVSSLAWHTINGRIRWMLNEFNYPGKILGTCNPSKGWVYESFYKPHVDGTLKEGRVFIQSLMSDNPLLSPAYIKKFDHYPEARKRVLFYGEWEQDSDNALISYDNILNVFTNTQVRQEGCNKYISCDAARQGSDKAVILLFDGFEVIERITYPKSGIDELQAAIVKMKTISGVPNSHIVIDEDGVGGGLVDFMKGSKGFVNNSTAINGENYRNLKTQCYYKFAEYVNAHKIYISCELSSKEKEEIIQEMEQIQSRDTDSESKLSIIDKDTVRKNIGRSSDWTDALAMRMIFELGNKRVTKYRIR